MLTNIRNYLNLFFLGLMIVFYSWVGYMDLFYDASDQAEAKVATQIEQYEKNNQNDKEKAQPPYGLLRAEIALKEYNKGVFEEVRGCNCGPIIDKYTEGYHAQWCTMFASWVTKEAGSPLDKTEPGNWRITNSRYLSEYLKANGTWYSREEVIDKGLEPEIGDFVIFWRGDFEDNLGHVDIVVDLNGEPGRAGLVGGNLKDRVKYRNFSYIQHYGFLGFGRPEKDGSIRQ